MYKYFIRPILFLFDPENVHHFTFKIIKFTAKLPFIQCPRNKYYGIKDDKLHQNIFGLNFINPVGLAAGFDKNAELFNELKDFGFGFIEIGTVTPIHQQGNPKKRLFRLKKDKALINRMGFNNKGVDKVIENLKKRTSKTIVIGGNIGKNTNSLADNYIKDYKINFKKLFPYIDYFVVNVSCPNVGSMAKLQDKDFQIELLNELQALNKQQNKSKPILLKISPDLNDTQLDEVIEIVEKTKIDGVIASNTSVDRKGLNTSKETLEKIGNGGLSGVPIKDKSTRVIKYLSDKSNKAFPIIGVGGIASPEDAIEKLKAGASLIQIFTGFIYEGPSLIKNINKEILKQNILQK
ncbi:MAG TPA: quinone-dependent dihydroorotate dehydrogenase [Crocinitomix sp.]|nr:quinone-dependent dihydroorotate dehydrogenase [Crocinitomix sp.]